jgi:Lysylphosphatidylglycerol synthase TM region
MSISNVFNRKVLQKPPFTQNILRLINAALLILLLSYFFLKIRNINLTEISNTISNKTINLWYLILSFLLVFVNYGFEIFKWKILTHAIENRTFKQAAKDVLLGTAAGILTPFMIGDFAGRASCFSKENIPKALVLNAFNSFTQTWAAMVYGCISLLLYLNLKQIAPQQMTYLAIFSFVCFLSLFILLNTKIKQRMSFLLPKNWQKTVLIRIEMLVKLKVVLFTLLRNLTYFLQYLLLFKALQIQVESEVIFIGVNLILLAKTFGFGINALSDLGLRNVLSLQFFENYGVSSINILCITSFIWFINVIFPALIGAIIPLFNKKIWN